MILNPNYTIWTTKKLTCYRESSPLRGLISNWHLPAYIVKTQLSESYKHSTHHIVAGLCSVDLKFSLNLWDNLLQQALLFLNILRASKINLHLSVYTHVYGIFGYNRSLAPPCIKVLFHIRHKDRPSWKPLTIQGANVGPAMDHYRCHHIYSWSTNLIIIAETVR